MVVYISRENSKKRLDWVFEVVDLLVSRCEGWVGRKLARKCLTRNSLGYTVVDGRISLHTWQWQLQFGVFNWRVFMIVVPKKVFWQKILSLLLLEVRHWDFQIFSFLSGIFFLEFRWLDWKRTYRLEPLLSQLEGMVRLFRFLFYVFPLEFLEAFFQLLWRKSISRLHLHRHTVIH
jgi:hypothetical protein